MKLENETGFAQTPSRKSYNPFDSDSEDTDVYVKSNVNPYDISFDKNADHEALSFRLENGDISWEEAILGSPAIPADASGEANLFRKDTELFTDKTVMECELPELMVCYKENAYHNVKDIVIDEGVPTNDKAWIKSKDIHGIENLSFPEALNGNINGDLGLENEHQAPPFIQDQTVDSIKCSGLGSEDLERHNFANQNGNSVEEDEFKHDLSKKESDSSWQSEGNKKTMDDMIYDTKNHRETDELNHAKVEKMFDEIRDRQLSDTNEANSVTVDKKVNEFSEEELGKVDAPLEHAKESSTKDLIMNDIAAITESNENPKKEPTLPQSSELHASEESTGSSVPDGLGCDSKVESGSIILDFNFSSTIPGKEEEKEEKAQQNLGAEKPPESNNVSVEKPPRPQTMSRHDDKAPGMDKCVHGEASFSADMPPPASILYMGPNARCGSISLRSESSTGSTRSFAFPVLQAEWNSSPVRMAKADQRHIHKHRGWVHSIMCCRF